MEASHHRLRFWSENILRRSVTVLSYGSIMPTGQRTWRGACPTRWQGGQPWSEAVGRVGKRRGHALSAACYSRAVPRARVGQDAEVRRVRSGLAAPGCFLFAVCPAPPGARPSSLGRHPWEGSSRLPGLEGFETESASGPRSLLLPAPARQPGSRALGVTSSSSGSPRLSGPPATVSQPESASQQAASQRRQGPKAKAEDRRKSS